MNFSSRAMVAFSAAALIVPSIAVAQAYSGPKCLGSFCMEGDLSPDTLSKQLGPSKQNWWRFRSQNKEINLKVVLSNRNEVIDIIVGDHLRWDAGYESMVAHVEDAALLDWKTGEGIGLGSSEEDLRNAYGKPTEEMKSILRDHGTQIESKITTYKGRPARAVWKASFEVRDGKITWIELSNSADPGPDCIDLVCTLGLSVRDLRKELGAPAKRTEEAPTNCFHSQDRLMFLYLGTMYDVDAEGVFFPTARMRL